MKRGRHKIGCQIVKSPHYEKSSLFSSPLTVKNGFGSVEGKKALWLKEMMEWCPSSISRLEIMTGKK